MSSQFTLIQSRYAWEEMWRELADEPLPSVDSESFGLEWWRHKICGASFGTMTRAWYLPVRHVETNMPVEWLREAGERLSGRLYCGHNIGGFDHHLLLREGWTIPALYHDSQIAAYVLDENQELKLEDLATSHLAMDGGAEERDLYVELARVMNLRIGATKKLPGKYKAEMWRLHPAKVAPYACRDALSSRQLMDKFWRELGVQGMRGVYQSLIEHDRVLFDMVEHGVTIDRAKLDAADEIVAAKAKHYYQRIIDMSGGQVTNPRSNPQLKKWCGTDSVSKKKLAKVLADPDCDETLPAKVDLIRERMLYDKAHSTYYAAMRDSMDGSVLHPALRITGAAVRLSCGRPPMQGIPRSDDKTHDAYVGIKDCIVAPPGRVLAEFDLSQAEIVMGAFYSRDPNLLQVIQTGVSLHDVVAKQSNVQRQVAKLMNLALQYGAGVDAYAELRMIPKAQAAKEVLAYHATMAGQRRFYEDAMKMAAQHGYIELWSGRRRHFNSQVKIHSASNAYSQGGVNELIRVANVRCAREVPEFKMGLTVHDCLLGDLPDDPKQIKEISHEVRRIMSDFPWLDLGIKADCKVGKSWATAKAIH